MGQTNSQCKLFHCYKVQKAWQPLMVLNFMLEMKIWVKTSFYISIRSLYHSRYIIISSDLSYEKSPKKDQVWQIFRKSNTACTPRVVLSDSIFHLFSYQTRL